MTRPGTDQSNLIWLIARFGVVGVGSVGVYFAALYLLRPTIEDTIFLTATAYLISTVFNFLLQNFFTFRSQTVHARKLLKYGLMHALCLSLNSTTMFLLVDLAGQNLYLAQLLTTGLVTVVSFFLSSRYVYKD